MTSPYVVYAHDGNIVRALWRGNTHTVLQHLREERRLTGTKEGCAEGDCGACLVLVGEPGPEGNGVHWRSANACFLPLTALHGRLLLTVESLGTSDTLHPVQQALVEQHASQCGFCTPGFVMSLYEQYLRSDQQASSEAVHRQLSGNLCRCTGYAPILRAAESMHALPRVTRDATGDAQVLQRVQAEAVLAGRGFSCGDDTAHLPASVDDVADLRLAYPDALLLGGSTDAGLWVTKRLDSPRRVIHLGRADGLREVCRSPDGVRLGAALPLTDAFAALLEVYPELDEYATRFASPAVRHQGTLGGNIANGSPIGDSMPVLLALDASLVLRCGRDRRTLPLEAFYLGYQRQALRPGEFIEAVQVPARAPGWFVRAYKVSKRCDDDISALSLAAMLHIVDGRVVAVRLAMGGMAAIPKRARRTEAAWGGAVFGESHLPALAAALAEDFQPISDHRASAHYRLRVAARLLRRLMLEHQGVQQARVIRIVREAA